MAENTSENLRKRLLPFWEKRNSEEKVVMFLLAGVILNKVDREIAQDCVDLLAPGMSLPEKQA